MYLVLALPVLDLPITSILDGEKGTYANKRVDGVTAEHDSTRLNFNQVHRHCASHVELLRSILQDRGFNQR
jgi:hypothetical protein